jgi:Protein of unknown function (DUF998)
VRQADRNALLGKAAVACGVYYVLAILALHAIQRDVNPLNVFMSEYVLGRAGVLMTTTFFVWAAGLAALAIAFRDTLTLHRKGKIGVVFLWIGVLGLIGSGLFPTDPHSRIATTAGALHVVSGLIALPVMTVGMILLSLEFGDDQRWRAIATIALTLAVFRLIPFLSGLVLRGGPGSGLAQRISIGVGIVWMILVGSRVTRISRNAQLP